MADAEPRQITSRQAWEMMQQEARVVLIDVRSYMEFLFIGHPVGAVNIAWIDEPDWIVNPRFAADVRQLVLGGMSHHPQGHDVPVLLICRSGKRSFEAGQLLLQEGFHDVFNIEDGFEGELDDHHHRSVLGGWRFEDLPWEQC